MPVHHPRMNAPRGLTASLLLLGCAQSTEKSEARPTQPEPVADSLVLERTMCLGTCPAYRIRVSSAGEIRFHSLNPGDTTRTAVDTAPAATLDSLVARAKAIGFYELPADIVSDRGLCPVAMSDASGSTTTIYARSGTKVVRDYMGCMTSESNRAPLPPVRQMHEFGKEIDSVLRSSRWARPAGRR